jgi:hypothetical protein
MTKYVIFENSDGSIQATVSGESVLAIIKKHGLKPRKDGTYKITEAMIVEMQELDLLSADAQGEA